MHERSGCEGAGYLMLIGGSEDRRGPMHILKRLMALNNAQTVVVIPSASSYPKKRLTEYQRAFSKLGIGEMIGLDIRSPREADKPENLSAVDRADIVFLTGGDQVQLVERIAGSALIDRVLERYACGMTLAGTSAGAAAASDPMIFDGDGRGFRKGTVHHGPGFGFLPGITVDTHFVRRGRIARLAQFLSSGLSRRGIGLGEDTALLISADRSAEVIGRGMVTLLDAEELQVSSYHDAEDGEQLTMEGFRLGYLAPGTRFDLQAWRVLEVQRPTPEVQRRSA